MAIPLDEWLGLLRSEYLDNFLPGGGAAVKLAMAPDVETVDVVLARVAGDAHERGFLVAWVDAAQTRVQMMDQLFFAIARQVDWSALAERWLRDRVAANGYTIPDGAALTDLDAIAEANDLTRNQFLTDVRRWIAAGLQHEFALAREFRTALAMLVHAQVNPQNVSPSDADVVMQWLRGEKCPLGPLKRMQIYQRIGRHNARLMLSSLCAFLPLVSYPGLAVLLDLRAVVSDAPAGTGGLRYSRAAVQDAYEVLRQCIDDTDELGHFLLVAAAGPGLIDNARRGLDSYSALKLRTSDEVRDRDRANPLGALVRLDIPEGAIV